MSACCNDDVVVNGNAKPLASIHNLPSDLDILSAGGGVAGRMIVDENETGRPQFHRPLNDFAGLDRCLIDGAVTHMIVADGYVTAVEVQM